MWALLGWVGVALAVSVTTRLGPVTGQRDELATSFLNIPFAAPPLGALRWAPPQPPTPWTQPPPNVWGPGCPQRCLMAPLICPNVTSEDCLQLNVFVPNDHTSSDRPLPVSVFFPGGNFRQGSAATLLYDSRRWVAEGRFVMVVTNYRLGALGWLVQDGVPSNLGIEDQLMALRWVRDNIAAFGGDPGSVTLHGQSAGATSIAFHLTNPASQGLFHRVVSQSSPLALPLKTARTGKKMGDIFLKYLGCAVGNMTCLRGATVDDIIAAQTKTNKHYSIWDPFLMFYPWTPLVTEQPIRALKNGKGAAVPAIFGTTTNETVIFIYEAFGANGMSDTRYKEFVVNAFILHIQAVLQRYPPNMGGNASMAAAYLATDYLFTCPNRAVARAMAKKAPMYLYQFEHPMSLPLAKVGWGNETHCYYQTCHGGELPFLFDSTADVGLQMTPPEERLTRVMQSYWAAFFRSSDPNTAPDSPVTWPRYDRASDQNLHLTTGAPWVEDGLRRDACDFWDMIGYNRTVAKRMMTFLGRHAASRRM